MPTGTLPASGKKLFERVYKQALSGSCKGNKECAAKTAWSAVKGAGWHKKDGKWAKKSELVETFSMYITKASMDAKGVMRWSSVNSDTDKDSYEERMSLDLYENFIDNVAQQVPLPELFKSAACSNYWCGGMPYVSISHYPDLNGEAVPGEVLELYIDGDKLKAKGILSNSPLGHSVYRSLKEDKEKPPDEKIRISIGFLDLAHRHGNGKMWVRDSLYSLCPECFDGVGNKVYMKGYLVHLALTRVPVNKRTEMVLEEKADMAKKVTRKEDAASIVGKDLAEELDMKSKVSAQRSDALIEMSESETPEETQELIEEVESNSGSLSDVTDAEEKTENEENSQEELVLESEADMKKKCMKEDGTVDEECMKKMKAKEMKSETVQKFEDDTMDKVVNEPHMMENMPYGGATTMEEAMKYVEAKNEAMYIMDMWSVFSNVAWNVLERSDIPDKRKAMVEAIDSFRNMLAMKAMVMFSVPEKENTIAQEPSHELKPALDALLSAVDNSIVLEGDLNNKLQFVQPVLQELGTAITDYVQTKSVAKNEPPAPDKNNDNLLEKITELIQPLSESVQQLRTQVGVLEAKSNVNKVEPKSRIPAPRSMQLPPNLIAKSEPQVKPGSLRDIINKSVGITE